MMKLNETNKKYFESLGQNVKITDESDEYDFYALIFQTWRKDKSKFEDTIGAIGRIRNEFYQFFGPYDIDILSLSDGAYLTCDGYKYIFLKKERITVGGEVLYYTGMLKKVYEEDIYED